MSYTILHRNKPSLQMLQYSEIIQNILIQKIDILTNVCQQIQMQWQCKYYQDQTAWEHTINQKNEEINSLQNQIENQKHKLTAKEQQVTQLQQQSVLLKSKHKKDKKRRDDQINEYIKTNNKILNNLKNDNTDQRRQLFLLRYDLKEHKENISDLQKQIKDMKSIKQCRQCIFHASSSTLRILHQSGSDLHHSGSHEHSIEHHSLFIMKKTSIDSMMSDVDHNHKHNQPQSPYKDQLQVTVNQSPLLFTNAQSIKRSTSADTGRSISGLYAHAINVKKNLPEIPSSKTDICEEVEINEQSE